MLSQLALIFGVSLPGAGKVHIDTSKLEAEVTKGLYGVFLEEINNAGEGGLYAELIQNRGFEDSNTPRGCSLRDSLLLAPKKPSFWEGYSKDFTMDWPYANMGSTPFWSAEGMTMNLTSKSPLAAASPNAVELDSKEGAKLKNDGFWGMSITSGATYDLSFFVKPETFGGSIEARLVAPDGKILSSQSLPAIKANAANWSRLSTKLKATSTDSKAHFELVMHGSGKLLIDFVSLMPTTKWRGLPLRPDLAQMIADLKPGFVRWPGGCVTEGITIETRPQWKETLGPLQERVPTFVPWGYWVSNGFGYHEWLLFCEALKAEPLYVFNAGISCAFRSGTYLSDEELDVEIQNILDAIEYATGPVTSKYGAMRAKAGHPKPFPMHMIEIGNEDQGPKYGERFKKIAAKVKAKYPKIKTILSSWIVGIDHAAINAAGPQMDIVDEHAYTPAYWSIQNFNSFGKYSRKEPWELYIGEFATNSGVGRGNMNATLGDAAYMMSMEKNGDLVKMGSYAPLLENTNRRQWEVNLIHFDSNRVFGRASYYACKLFAENLPTINVATDVQYTPPGDSAIKGKVGLGTYGTTAEFKDIHINGEPIKGDWNPVSGNWKQSNGTYAQQSRDFDLWGYFGESIQDATLELKAKKIAGDEGFVVSVGNAEGRRVQVNFGGWGNRDHAIEAQGVVRRVAGKIETGRWYDIKVVTKGRQIMAYLDGKLIFDETLKRVDTVLSVAGLDKSTGDIIIKLLNTGAYPAEMKIALDGLILQGTGTVTRLHSDDKEAENSYESPRKIYPEITPVKSVTDALSQTLPPHSVNILRLKTKSAQKRTNNQ